MSVIGIICEYNPFHSGHAYQMAAGRELLREDCPVICVMSGDFVQRGEPAMYSKFARAEACCRCGADLVIELPVQWSLSSAEGFAKGAAGLLDRLGATHLCFGSESGDTKKLNNIAELLLKPEFNAEVKDVLKSDASLSYAAARELAAKRHIGFNAIEMEKPNNILGIEYIKALHEMKSSVIPLAIKRTGSGHDEIRKGSGPKSATEIREIIRSGGNACSYIPENALFVYEKERERGMELTDKNYFELAALSRLIMLDEKDFEELPDGSDGIGRRLYKAVQSETDIAAIIDEAKTKRYALSRIRRMLLCACLGIKAGMNMGTPPYARVLAANERGCQLINAAGKAGKIPVLTKPAAVKNLSPECENVFRVGAAAHDFYNLCLSGSKRAPAGEDWRKSPVIVK